MTMVRLTFRTSVSARGRIDDPTAPGRADDPTARGGAEDAEARAPDIEDALRHLHLDPDEVDLGYGLQLLDPGTGEWVLLVDEAAARRVAARSPASGAYADVRIQDGPPEPSEG